LRERQRREGRIDDRRIGEGIPSDRLYGRAAGPPWQLQGWTQHVLGQRAPRRDAARVLDGNTDAGTGRCFRLPSRPDERRAQFIARRRRTEPQRFRLLLPTA
jgi:hypothetical protein